jgi:hypothetical protein
LLFLSGRERQALGLQQPGPLVTVLEALPRLGATINYLLYLYLFGLLAGFYVGMRARATSRLNLVVCRVRQKSRLEASYRWLEGEHKDSHVTQDTMKILISCSLIVDSKVFNLKIISTLLAAALFINIVI